LAFILQEYFVPLDVVDGGRDSEEPADPAGPADRPTTQRFSLRIYKPIREVAEAITHKNMPLLYPEQGVEIPDGYVHNPACIHAESVNDAINLLAWLGVVKAAELIMIDIPGYEKELAEIQQRLLGDHTTEKDIERLLSLTRMMAAARQALAKIEEATEELSQIM
jgi:hypothetical protein